LTGYVLKAITTKPNLVRKIFEAVKSIHGSGTVQCGIQKIHLEQENLLFRTFSEDANITIVDFGISRIMEEDKLSKLTGTCGTSGYMAPEISKKTRYGKPVDIWVMGAVIYFLLSGYTSFDRDSPKLQEAAIVSGDYKFEPEEYWVNVSDTAKDFIRSGLRALHWCPILRDRTAR